MKTLENKFQSAKQDIQSAWDYPLRPNARITREWIYTVDLETMAFAKFVFDSRTEGSLYDVFCDIMQAKNFNNL